MRFLLLLFWVSLGSACDNANIPGQISACTLSATENGLECTNLWNPYTITTSGWEIIADTGEFWTPGRGWVYLQYKSINSDDYTVWIPDSTFCEQYEEDSSQHTHNITIDPFYYPVAVWIGCNNLVEDCSLDFYITMFFPENNTEAVLGIDATNTTNSASIVSDFPPLWIVFVLFLVVTVVLMASVAICLFIRRCQLREEYQVL